MSDADGFRGLVRKRTGLAPDQLVCPREKSEMTPCVARDGGLAAAETIQGDVCVGCDQFIAPLLKAEIAKESR